MSNSKNPVKTKSFAFALEIIKLYKFLIAEKKEYVMSKQLLRSGTAVGALIKEAEHAESKADFVHKMSIALKEANESEYWILLLRESDYLEKDYANNLLDKNIELLKLLISIVKSTKRNLNR